MSSNDTLSSGEHLRAVYSDIDADAIIENCNNIIFLRKSEGVNLQMVDDPTHSVTVGPISDRFDPSKYPPTVMNVPNWTEEQKADFADIVKGNTWAKVLFKIGTPPVSETTSEPTVSSGNANTDVE
jgi:hypothetical protein